MIPGRTPPPRTPSSQATLRVERPAPSCQGQACLVHAGERVPHTPAPRPWPVFDPGAFGVQDQLEPAARPSSLPLYIAQRCCIRSVGAPFPGTDGIPAPYISPESSAGEERAGTWFSCEGPPLQFEHAPPAAYRAVR